MTYVSNLLTIAGLYLLVAISPGPGFFVITQHSLSGERRIARSVAWGLSAGTVFWTLLAMFGIARLLASADWLYLTVRLAGAAYLIWLGVKLLLSAARSTDSSITPAAPVQLSKAWRTGFITSLTNPKSGIFWTSVFAATFPANAPLWFFALTALMISVLSLGWHLGLAMAFTSSRIQACYQRLRRPIDALAGAILIAFGLRLASAR